MTIKLSIVATLYQSANYIDQFYKRATVVAQQFAADNYEIIFVNDGSPDSSLDLAIDISRHDNHVIVIDLSRNFGHHNAMKIGLENTKGEYVFLIDSDLEEEPEWLLPFSAQMKVEQADVIYGVQEKRKGGWFERYSGVLYYKILNWLLSIKHPKNITTARLMTRRYVDALMNYREIETIISCLWVITGFKQCPMPVKKTCKKQSTYGIFKKFSYFVNTITSFSAAPLKMIFFCGVFIFFVTMFYATYLIVGHYLMSKTVEGWTSIMVSVWMLGGMMISFIGILGIYLSKIFLEVKQRPYAIIRKIYGKTDE
ncbi:glycosyltransferase family 2 protein [Legionella feeleii]|uniref:Bactoprenol glucosyl transferase CPS-53 (KpLE1) prophage n=1 Tax=Legionella feeleii TaxID=453 RepID=A0A378IY45_9GAMM|nr:glycosyltransferase family 2 protein [Legionella feeleii]STX39953.1 bactoprenol glucosyl transferase; CPS-53 (KpLE1) prophage [Legionella feeleii]